MRCTSQIFRLTVGLLFVALALVLQPQTAAADSFYDGKTLKVIIRSSPGGGYDFYGRLIARHISKYIPGNPDTIAVNMPGGGGLVAANYLASRAKRDGTEIAVLAREIAISQRLGQTGVKYDVKSLNPIGSAAASTRVWTVRAGLPIKDMKDLKDWGKTAKFSATGPGAGSFQLVKLLDFDGYPVKPITGYEGTPERVLAVARGEVEGTSGSYESLIKPIEEGDLKVIGRLGASIEGMDVPDVRKFLSSDGRGLASFMAAPLAAGRPFFTAPGTPEDRVRILREAFEKVLKDPELLSEAKRADRSIQWTSGEELEEIYRDILNATEKVVKTFKEMTS